MINNTDIFTRLDWLTNRVNRILGALQNGGGGGGGSQTIDQVLATGSTATNKSLLMNDTLGIVPSSIGIGSTFGSLGGVLAGIKLEGPNGNFINTTNTSYFNRLVIDFTEQNTIDGSGIRGFYGRSQFGLTSLTTSDYFFAGFQNGYGSTLGWTLANNAGNQIQANASNIYIVNNDPSYSGENTSILISAVGANDPKISVKGTDSAYTNTEITNNLFFQTLNGGDAYTYLTAGNLSLTNDISGNVIDYGANSIFVTNANVPGSYSEIVITDSTLSFNHNVTGGTAQSYLSIDTANQNYNFGDAGLSHGLFINSGSNTYFLGDMGSGNKGLSIDLNSGDYNLGDSNGCHLNIKIYENNHANDYMTSSFSGGVGGESGLGLFNNIGHYQLGDFGGTAQPNTDNVYLDVSSSKSDSSIKTYYNGFNTGLLLDFNAGRYVINIANLGSGDAWFGVKTVSGIGGYQVPCLDMTYSILGSPAAAVPTQFSWVRVEVQGTRFWIPLYSD